MRLRSRVRRAWIDSHLGVDRRLLADLELVDLGPLGAVDVATRVVLEQVEHGLDAHLRQPRRAASSPTALSSVTRLRRELAQREAGASRTWCSATPVGLLDADEVRVERLVTVVHLDLDVGMVRRRRAR